jgi:hypothetical protein
LGVVIGGKVAACAIPTAQRVTGYQVGGTSPFGTATPLPLYMEQSIAALPHIHLNGGERGFLIGMTTADLVRLLKPTLITVAMAKDAAAAAAEGKDKKPTAKAAAAAKGTSAAAPAPAAAAAEAHPK